MANRSPTEELRELRAAGPERGRQPSLTQTWGPRAPCSAGLRAPPPRGWGRWLRGACVQGDACAGQRCWRSELRFLHLCLQTLVAAPTHSHAPRGPSDSEWPEVTHLPPSHRPQAALSPERETDGGWAAGRHLSLSSVFSRSRSGPFRRKPGRGSRDP